MRMRMRMWMWMIQWRRPTFSTFTHPGSRVPLWQRRGGGPGPQTSPWTTCCSWHRGWLPTPAISYHGRLSVAKKDPSSNILPPMTVFISLPLFFRSSRARLNWKPFLLTFGRWNFRCSTGLNTICRDHRQHSWLLRDRSHNNHDYLRLWWFSAGSADHWEGAGLAPQGHDLQVWTKHTFHICSASFFYLYLFVKNQPHIT